MYIVCVVPLEPPLVLRGPGGPDTVSARRAYICHTEFLNRKEKPQEDAVTTRYHRPSRKEPSQIIHPCAYSLIQSAAPAAFTGLSRFQAFQLAHELFQAIPHAPEPLSVTHADVYLIGCDNASLTLLLLPLLLLLRLRLLLLLLLLLFLLLLLLLLLLLALWLAPWDHAHHL